RPCWDHKSPVPFFSFKLSTCNLALRPPRLIAPFSHPEYPLPSCGGLGCESVRQGSGSSLELSSQLFFVLRRKRSNGIKNSFPKCAGAALVHSAEAAPWPSPVCRTSPTSSTWPPSTAASGRPPISGTLGIRFSTTSPPAPSARLPLLLPIRTLFTLAVAKDYSARISQPEMASTNPLTPENPGHI